MSFTSITDDLLLAILQQLGGDMNNVQNLYSSTTNDLLHAIWLTLGGGGGGGGGGIGSQFYRSGSFSGKKGTTVIPYKVNGVNTPLIDAGTPHVQAYNGLGTVAYEVTSHDDNGFEIDLMEDAFVNYQVLKET